MQDVAIVAVIFIAIFLAVRVAIPKLAKGFEVVVDAFSYVGASKQRRF